MPRVRTPASLLPNQSRKLLISFGSIDIKVAALKRVATFFFAFMFEHIWSGGGNEFGEYLVGGDYQEGFSPRSCLATTNFSPVKLK